jgi:hypothetical protein
VLLGGEGCGSTKLFGRFEGTPSSGYGDENGSVGQSRVPATHAEDVPVRGKRSAFGKLPISGGTDTGIRNGSGGSGDGDGGVGETPRTPPPPPVSEWKWG